MHHFELLVVTATINQQRLDTCRHFSSTDGEQTVNNKNGILQHVSIMYINMSGHLVHRQHLPQPPRWSFINKEAAGWRCHSHALKSRRERRRVPQSGR